MTAAGRGARRTVITAASVIPAFCRILITASVCVKWPVPVPQNAATNRSPSTFDSSMPATGTTDLRLFARPVATLSTTFSTGFFHKLMEEASASCMPPSRQRPSVSEASLGTCPNLRFVTLCLGRKRGLSSLSDPSRVMQ